MTNRDRAVSNVVGVSILIGVVVLISVVLAAFALGFVNVQLDNAADKNVTGADYERPGDRTTDRPSEKRSTPTPSASPDADVTYTTTYLCGSGVQNFRQLRRSGYQPANDTPPMLNGSFATTIQIANPRENATELSVAIGSGTDETTLGGGQTVTIDCSDIASINGSDAMMQYGMVIIESERPVVVEVIRMQRSRLGADASIVRIERD